MGWPQEAYLYLRQIVTPKARPQPGGNLLYVKSDDKLYLMNASGVEAPVETALGDVTLNGTQTLTNKTISADNNTLSGIAASSFVLSNGSGNIDGAAAQKAIPAGVVVGTTDTQTLTNKTLSTGTLVGAATTDISGAWASYTPTLTNVTLGNGTMTAKYVQFGKTTHFYINIVFGTTSTWGTGWTMTLPATPATAGEWRFPVGAKDTSASSWYTATAFQFSGATMNFGVTGGSSQITSGFTATVPFTWASSDIFSVTGTYEAA